MKEPGIQCVQSQMDHFEVESMDEVLL